MLWRAEGHTVGLKRLGRRTPCHRGIAYRHSRKPISRLQRSSKSPPQPEIERLIELIILERSQLIAMSREML